MTDKIKIALAQMNVIPGAPDKNLETMLRFIEDAKQEKADLVVFPEMCVGGYLLGDRWLEDDFCLNLMSYNKDILNASKGIAVAFGNIYLDPNEEIRKRTKSKAVHPNKDGRTRKYNAVYIFQDGKPAKRLIETNILPAGIHPKTLLPNYREFDDERYFFSLKDVARDFNVSLEEIVQPFLINVKGKEIPMGFELCEDLWCEDYRENKNALNITKKLIENGAKYIINLSASPWTFGKNKARDKRVLFLKKESNKKFVPFFYVNCTGVQNNGKNIITFDGGSTVYNKYGKPIILTEPYKQGLILVDENDSSLPEIEREEKPKIAQKYEAIIRGIRSMYSKFVIGMSGGIDSAVIAALLTRAVGKDRVLGVNMPTQFNSGKTKDAAAYTANRLGIAYKIIPIQKLVDLNEEILNKIDMDGSNKKLSVLNVENIQAKIRGTSMLSNLAAKYDALFTNNGNKDEVFLGYATLYGDVGGAFAPIGDLTKIEVVELAKYMNREIFKDEVIPATLIPDKLWNFTSDQIQPSAELKENQVDPIKFVYHCALVDAFTDYKKKSAEDIMRLYLGGTLHQYIDSYLEGLDGGDKIGYKIMERWNVTNPNEFIKDIEWLEGQMRKNVFKRVQGPPIIITSKSAFGYDIRESILPQIKTRERETLKEKILAMDKYVPREVNKNENPISN